MQLNLHRHSPHPHGPLGGGYRPAWQQSAVWEIEQLPGLYLLRYQLPAWMNQQGKASLSSGWRAGGFRAVDLQKDQSPGLSGDQQLSYQVWQGLHGQVFATRAEILQAVKALIRLAQSA